MLHGLHDDPAIVLYDFEASFPSVSRAYLMASAAAARLPGAVMGVLRSLYHNTVGILVVHGHMCTRVPMTAGIRQGCPLSPLLFALASDGLLRVLAHRHPTATTRAFADDTAMVLIRGEEMLRGSPVFSMRFHWHLVWSSTSGRRWRYHCGRRTLSTSRNDFSWIQTCRT